MYYVKDQHCIGIFNGVKKVSAEIYADTLSDLPAYNNCNGVDGELTLGTTAVIAGSGDKYMLNSTGEWNEVNFGKAIRIKGRVDSVSELPSVAEPGWLYFVGQATDEECDEYVYTEEQAWEHVGTGFPITIDDELSQTSENPVQNKVVTQALGNKQDALTEEQLAAVSSGINGEKVAKYDDIYAVMNYNAMNHNGIYRGKDLTNIYTVEEIYERVHNGTFEDLYLGDYITKEITFDIYSTFTGSAFVAGTTYYERSGVDLNHWVYTVTSDTTYDSGKTYYTHRSLQSQVNFVFLGFNYYLHKGVSTAILTQPHIVLGIMTPEPTNIRSCYNSTNNLQGAYYYSELHQTFEPCVANSIRSHLNNHIVTFSNKLTTEIDDNIQSAMGSGLMGASSNSSWYNTEVQTMNEVQLTGNSTCSSSYLDVLSDNTQLPIFHYITIPQYMKKYGTYGTTRCRTIMSKDYALCISQSSMPVTNRVPSSVIEVFLMCLFG